MHVQEKDSMHVQEKDSMHVQEKDSLHVQEKDGMHVQEYTLLQGGAVAMTLNSITVSLIVINLLFHM